MRFTKETPRYYIGTEEYDKARMKIQRLHQEHTFAELARRDPLWAGRLSRLCRGKGRMTKPLLDEIDAYLDIYIMLQ